MEIQMDSLTETRSVIQMETRSDFPMGFHLRWDSRTAIRSDSLMDLEKCLVTRLAIHLVTHLEMD